VSSRLCGELAPTQQWSPAQLAPMRELTPTGVLKNRPLEPILPISFGSSPGGVAQWTLHPPQEPEDPGLNPARV
jgi:hypothetical protein